MLNQSPKETPVDFKCLEIKVSADPIKPIYRISIGPVEKRNIKFDN